jgi:hypothetical protein
VIKKAITFSIIGLTAISVFFCATVKESTPFQILSAGDSLTAPFPSITFSTADGADSYTILRKLAPASNYDSIAATAELSFIDYDTALAPESTYSYRIKADNPENSLTDSVLIAMPPYMVFLPKKGDSFRIGDSINVRMKSSTYAKSGLKLVFGMIEVGPPGANATFNMQTTPVQSFVIPQTFTLNQWVDSLQHSVQVQVSPVSDSCYIRVFNYDVPSEDYAVSYGYFSIIQ